MNQKEFNEVIIRQTDRCKSMLVAKVLYMFFLRVL